MELNNIYTTPVVKKDPLAPNWSEQKYAAVTMPSGHSFLTGPKAREDSKELYRKYSRLGRKKMHEFWDILEEMGKDDIAYDATNDFHSMGLGVAAIRRKAIEFVYVHICHAPAEIDWKRLKLIVNICRILQINPNSQILFKRYYEISRGHGMPGVNTMKKIVEKAGGENV